MDMKWIIEENSSLVSNGRIRSRSAVANILNAVAMSEQQTILEYTAGKQAIMDFCKDDENLCNIICKMLDSIISDETSHQMSAQKAANICQGVEQPKDGREFKEAAKGNDVKTI